MIAFILSDVISHVEKVNIGYCCKPDKDEISLDI